MDRREYSAQRWRTRRSSHEARGLAHVPDQRGQGIAAADGDDRVALAARGMDRAARDRDLDLGGIRSGGQQPRGSVRELGQPGPVTARRDVAARARAIAGHRGIAGIAGKRLGGEVTAGVIGPSREYPPVPLPQIAWSATVAICVIASVILFLSDYFGYAGVVFAVALAAAINLR